jgi:hypothetical protein
MVLAAITDCLIQILSLLTFKFFLHTRSYLVSIDSLYLVSDRSRMTDAVNESQVGDKLAADSQARGAVTQRRQNAAADNDMLAKQGFPTMSVVGASTIKPQVETTPSKSEAETSASKSQVGTAVDQLEKGAGMTYADNGQANPQADRTLVEAQADSSGGNSKPTEQTSENKSSDDDLAGAVHVSGDLAEGALNEVKNHPGHLALNAGIGIAVGIGAAVTSPGWLLAAGGLAAGAGVYELDKHAGSWIDDAKVVASPEGHSSAEVSQANNGLQAVGGGIAELTAGSIGGTAGAALEAGITGGFTAATAAVSSDDSTAMADSAHTLDKAVVQTINADPARTPMAAPAQTSDAAPPLTSNVAPAQTSDIAPPQTSDVAPAQTSDATPQMVAAAPKQASEVATAHTSQAAPAQASDAGSLPASDVNSFKQDLPVANTETAATKATATETGQARTPEERAKIVDLLATGKVEDITHGQDAGLMKDVTFAKVSKNDQSTDGFIKKIDTSNPMELSRIRQAQIQANVDSITGINSGAPESAIRRIPIDGEDQWVGMQENAGKSLGANLSDWAYKKYGRLDSNENVPDEDVQNLIEAHPALKNSVANGFLQVLYQGNPDLLGLSNLAIRGTQGDAPISLDEPMQIPIIDAKFNWTSGLDENGTLPDPPPAPNWGQNAATGQAAAVAKLYAGKRLSDISPALQESAEGIQKVFESAAGRTQLQNAGLTPAEIDGATARLRYLTTTGFPPLYTPEDPGFFDLSLPEFGQAGQYAYQRSQSLTLDKVLAGQQIPQSPQPVS